MVENIKKSKIMFTDTKLEVPYFSQYLSVEGKEECLKACGMTCAYMVLSYHDINVPSLNEMVMKGINKGGFGPSGWNHDYFVDLFNRNGLLSERKESMRVAETEIIKENILTGNPVIISAERVLFDKKIFHQVLIVGIREDENGKLEGFFYHDPASLQPKTAMYCYVPLGTFLLSWRKMAIFAQKKS